MNTSTIKILGVATLSAGALLVIGGIGAASAVAPADRAAAATPNPSATPAGGTVVLQGDQSLPGKKSLASQGQAKRLALKGYIADSIWHNNVAWGANVRVTSGSYGAYTTCSNGRTHRGPRQGPGYWIFGGDCRGIGTLVDFGVYGSG
ncbi:hypothetical protein [Actinomadura kijaniata]|uniref:hypothetical protein n=1 Tax=Actinomadura kijaniata TaxID=46161 RepID=UPI0008352278|nr:hypothetical protein [Actinomadura kijaniata]